MHELSMDVLLMVDSHGGDVTIDEHSFHDDVLEAIDTLILGGCLTKEENNKGKSAVRISDRGIGWINMYS